MPGNKKASVRPSAQGLTLVTSAILYLAQRSGASAENERFMSLTSECLPGDVINVTLTTPEPFQVDRAKRFLFSRHADKITG